MTDTDTLIDLHDALEKRDKLIREQGDKILDAMIALEQKEARIVELEDMLDHRAIDKAGDIVTISLLRSLLLRFVELVEDDENLERAMNGYDELMDAMQVAVSGNAAK